VRPTFGKNCTAQLRGNCAVFRAFASISHFSRLNDRTPAFLNSRTRYGITVAQVSQLNFTVNANIRFNLKYDVQHQSPHCQAHWNSSSWIGSMPLHPNEFRANHRSMTFTDQRISA
jgi:hypothetical protein